MSFLSISFSASAAGRTFILTLRSLQQNYFFWNRTSTASDMSVLSNEQELGEVGEVDEGPLQNCTVEK
jgi:hypothetical protein